SPPLMVNTTVNGRFSDVLVACRPSNIQHQVAGWHGLAGQAYRCVLGFFAVQVAHLSGNNGYRTAFALPHAATAGHRQPQAFAKPKQSAAVGGPVCLDVARAAEADPVPRGIVWI